MNDLPPWRVVEWPELDSTNAAAHRWLNKPVENSASNGHRLVFTTPHQTAGRGQQSRPWHGQKGMDLAMSVVLTDSLPSACPFALNLAVSLAVLEGVEKAMPKLEGVPWEIKWPNDLMLRGKKAGGILIENSWRGHHWASSVIGIGLNMGGRPPYPNATSLLDDTHNLESQLDITRTHVLNQLNLRLAELNSPKILLQQYHERLLGWGQAQRWQLDGQEIRGILESIDLQGKICVLDASGQQCYAPGEVGWLGMEPS